jgi:cytochrome b6-f complex iron-sulfur subunit
MEDDTQTRRQFCHRTCSAAMIAALGGVAGVLQACGGGGSSPTSPGGSAAALPTVSGTATGGTVTVTIDAASPLAAAGSLAFVRSSQGNFLVARTSPDAFSAFTTVCTHEGNTITAYSGQVFVCPAHGAQFDSSGRVVAGPARTALRSYPTQFAGNVLTINA